MAAGFGILRAVARSRQFLADLVHPEVAQQERLYEQQVNQLLARLRELYGSEVLAQRLQHLRATDLIDSPRLEERVLAIQRLVQGDSSLEIAPSWQELPQILPGLQEQVEEQCNRAAASEPDRRVESQRRTSPLWQLEALLEERYSVCLPDRAADVVKPRSLAEVIGQDHAKRALWAKLASPHPQHVLVYGPPGSGKSSLVRLVCDQVKQAARDGHAGGGGGDPGAGRPDAPFVEVDAASLSASPSDLADPLCGSVHDPIYQGGRPDLAAAGLPDPHLGLVTRAHGGVLFIDNIDALPPALLAKLTRILDEGRVRFHSNYYDPTNPAFPPAVRRLFEEGAPANFVLIGATSHPPAQLPLSLRSRCAEIHLDPLLPSQIRAIVAECARKLGVTYEPEVAEKISRQTTDGRRAVQLVLDAYGLACLGGERRIRTLTLARVLEQGRGAGGTDGRQIAFFASRRRQPQVGLVHGLAVSGWVGSVLGIEAMAGPARLPGQGRVRFNTAAGQMARDAVFTSLSLIRRRSNLDPDDWDIHINILGGGQVEGPSLGAPVLLAVASALWRLPLSQDVAVTGEISLSGQLYPVGGIVPKLIAAQQAGFRLAVVPAAQRTEVPTELQADGDAWRVQFADGVDDLWALCFPGLSRGLPQVCPAASRERAPLASLASHGVTTPPVAQAALAAPSAHREQP